MVYPKQSWEKKIFSSKSMTKLEDLTVCLVFFKSSCEEGPTELVQRLAYRESSHRPKGAARHKTDLVWLLTPILVGRKGVFYMFK
jgi:hypothetical protein